MGSNEKRVRPVALTLFIVLVALVPLMTRDPYYLDVLIRIAFYVALGAGIWLVMSIGLITSAHAAFVGIGAYTSALLVMNLGWPFWGAIAAAGLAAVLVALVIGIPVLRLSGVYFVIVTIAFSEVMRLLWVGWESLTGGAPGIRGIPPPDQIDLPGLPSIVFASANASYYYLMLVIVLVTMLVIYRLSKSRVGLTLRSIEQASILAQHSGVNIMIYKVIAFVLACFFAGVAGSFYAHYFRFISPEAQSFTLQGSLYMIVYVVVGGPGSIAGPVVGPLVLVPIAEVLRPFREYLPIVYGAILIVVVMFMPDGLVVLPQRVARLFRRRGPSRKRTRL